MKIQIGAFDKDKNAVPVTFTDGDVVHTRDVNACLSSKGKYDAAATNDRVAQVALGVAKKIALGVIVNVPEPVAADDPSPAEATEPG